MPSDIRSFFGGKPAQSSSNPSTPATPKKQDASSARKKRSRKVVDESDEDESIAPAKVATPKANPKSKVKSEEPKGEPTTTSDYFSTSKKGGKSSKVSVEPPAVKVDTTKKRSTKKAVTIVEEDAHGDDDIFASEYGKRKDDDYVGDGDSDDDDDDDFEILDVKPVSKRSQKRTAIDEDDEDDDLVMEELPRPAPRAAARASRKRKSSAIIEEDEDDEVPKETKKPVSRAKASKVTSSPAAKRQKAAPKKKAADEPEDTAIQAILDSIPQIRPPSPPPDDAEKKKFQFGAARSRTPPISGTRDIPVGEENCLVGLTFVFTGILDTLGREEGQELVKKYGGKVTGAPSSKTSYVVLGGDAGPSKLKKIANFKIKTINEDGLFELIRRLPANGGSGKAAGEYEAKKKANEEKIREMAAEIDAEEKKQQKALAQSSKDNPGATPQTPAVDTLLWTSKYAPTSTAMICGNKGAVEKIQDWLRNWFKNAKNDFKNGSYRAIMIHGPPGIGKTTAAHLVAKLEGFDIVETNASDTRSKKLVENTTMGILDTTSLQGYFAGDGKKVESGKKKMVLIMDEVDGMSAGDRGGVGAVAAIAKKTNIPIILICNDRKLPKMKPFDFVTLDIPFRRPTVDQIRARLSTICFREKLKIPPPVLDALIEGTHADIRQVINMLSAAKLGQEGMDFDKGKEMSKAWEKHIILKPWDIVSKILSAQMFSPSSTTTLGEKIELYFNDHEFSYLMLQENYLRTRPSLANSYQDSREHKLKLLELADNAASSISDGDLVDRMIHGTQQQWSLMPTHAVFSFVRPASYQYGNMNERPAFASWLGQNSRQGKLSRFVKEIQGHMRLRTTGNRDEIREQYLPSVWDKSVRRLRDEGKDSVEEVIEFMDAYFLTRDDFDAVMELGLGPMDQSNVKLETQTKATFTRLYNQRSHPLSFMKASNVVATKKGAKEKPDIEDALEESDEEEEVIKDDEETDLKKDKYVSMPKKKGAAKGAAKGKATKATKSKKSKAAAEDDDDGFIDDEDEKPKKARKPRAKKA